MADYTLRRLPEWSPKKQIIMGWPGLQGTLRDHPDRLEKATKEISAIALAISQFQEVILVVGSERYEEADTQFGAIDTPFPIKLHKIDNNSMDVWLRAFGPTFVVKRPSAEGAEASIVGLDWNFNGWGNRYLTPTSEQFAQRFLRDFSYDRVETSIVTEGGALEVNGEGILVATKSSIINENRNPGKTHEEIEAELKRKLGIEKIIWIPGRPNMDSTDCNINALMRFISPSTVCISRASNFEQDPAWIVVYEKAYDILINSTTIDGQSIRLLSIDEPDPSLFPDDGFGAHRGVRSYVNYLLVDGAIIVPQFGDTIRDKSAISTFTHHWPERKVVPVLIEELPRLGGGIHSVTQEIPLLP